MWNCRQIKRNGRKQLLLQGTICRFFVDSTVLEDPPWKIRRESAVH
jgi:hypothetical protein